METKKEKNNVTLEELKKIEETSENLGREIRMISRAFKKIASTGLKEETIVVLLTNSTGIQKTHVREIIKGLKELEKDYCNDEKRTT